MESLTLGNVTLRYKNPEKQVAKLKSLNDLDLEDFGNDPSSSEDDDDNAEKQERKYEVENIIDRCNFGNSVFYLVKWKYWNSKYNTWEPGEHLDCKKRIDIYKRCVEKQKYPNKCIDEYLRLLVKADKATLEQFMSELLTKKSRHICNVLTELDIRKRVTNIPKADENKRALYVERLKHHLKIKYLFVFRTRQLTALREWKEEIAISSNDGIPLEVENNMDLAVPPDNFFYVNEYIPGTGVIIPDDPPVGCKCETCDTKSKCCSSLAKFKFAYSPQGLLNVSPDTPIYECNKKCRCNKNCSNRVVQKGRQIKLCIFRTSSGCGWGVKTLENIKKGCFVCCYVGEVIDNDEAERRVDLYHENQDAYMFDMDYNGSNYKYTVDGTTYGNVSRFVNHSCKPNLTVCFVWIDCLDPSLPQLAFFTTEFIQAGRELTIDYIGDSIKVDNTIKRTKPCKCGREGCKKFIL